MRDFTLTTYARLLETIRDSGYSTPSMADFISDRMWERKGYHCVLRHDIDRKIVNAVKMAELEHSIGVVSTYYVRYIPGVYDLTSLKKIQSYDHEIGFHYETLDKAKGNVDEAYELFLKELEEIRKHFDIRTICMHGWPLNPWRNLDIWQKYDYRKLGIIGEPYLDIDFKKTAYFTDTGMGWSTHARVKDNVAGGNYNELIGLNPKTTEDLIEIIKSRKHSNIVILAHPNRWTDNAVEWAWEYLWQKTKNIGKVLLKKRMDK